MGWTLTSQAFTQGSPIPRQHTADGPGLSPPLSWTAPPDATVSLCLVVEDPDAPGGTWCHWLVYDMPAGARSLAQGTLRVRNLPDGSRQGVNDFGRLGWGGPSPPPGPAHRYVLRLLALDVRLGLPGSERRDRVLGAAAGHVLAETRLIGTYGRRG